MLPRLTTLLLAFLAITSLSTTVGAAPPRYTDNLDGTITDTTTGLMWKRCAEGQTWTGVTCYGIATTYTWDQAQAQATASTYAGYNDWFVPNIRSLQTIVDFTVFNPAIDSDVFPNTPSYSFWSGSPSAIYPSYYKWYMHFGYGSAEDSENWSQLCVRLVRKTKSFSLNLVKDFRVDTDYRDNGDGTVTHIPTSLMWKRCSEGQNWDGMTCTGRANDYSWSTAKKLTSNFANYGDWRLPKEDELSSLVDYTHSSLTWSKAPINETWFPNTPMAGYWSSSSYAGDSSNAWDVHFSKGVTNYFDKDSYQSVRFVRRAGHYFFLSIQKNGAGDGIITSIPYGINCGLDCKKNYPSGAQVTLTATPNVHSTFSGWLGDCSSAGTAPTCVVAMKNNHNVTAKFRKRSN